MLTIQKKKKNNVNKFFAFLTFPLPLSLFDPKVHFVHCSSFIHTGVTNIRGMLYIYYKIHYYKIHNISRLYRMNMNIVNKMNS